MRTLTPAAGEVGEVGKLMQVIEVVSMVAQQRVASKLHALDCETFIPTYQREIRHARRIEHRTMPLFSRYMFSACLDRVSEVLRIREVTAVLRKAGSLVPHTVDERALALLRNPVLIEGTDVVDGDEVIVKYGRWKDLIGIARFDDEHRMTLLLSILGRPVEIPMSVHQTERLSSVSKAQGSK